MEFPAPPLNSEPHFYANDCDVSMIPLCQRDITTPHSFRFFILRHNIIKTRLITGDLSAERRAPGPRTRPGRKRTKEGGKKRRQSVVKNNRVALQMGSSMNTGAHKGARRDNRGIERERAAVISQARPHHHPPPPPLRTEDELRRLGSRTISL